MLSLRLAIFVSVTVLGLSLVQLLLLRVLNTCWWRIRWVKYASLGFVAYVALSSVIWISGAYMRDDLLAQLGAFATTPGALIGLVLVATLPVSGIVNTIQYWYVRRRQKRGLERQVSPQSQTRRALVRGIAAAVPLSALGMATVGMARSFSRINVRDIPFYFPDLPAELDGFRILHLSDSHLGPYIDLDDVEALMLDAEQAQPHLVLISGDIADHLSMLPDAIKLFEGIKPPYGAYACMGNHDYYRGARRVISNFGSSSIPMLINQGLNLKVGRADLFVGGADDPIHMNRPINDFMRQAVDKTVRDAPDGAFKIVMSHRPTGFDRAAELGIDLTVSGHTHGGQIGIWGKPLFENWGRERYVWGKYQNGPSQLYTSSGVGHWFPFRLGCPTEAPILVLKRLSSA